VKSLAARLAAWYAVIFIILLAFVVVVSSMTLLSMLRREGHKVLDARANEVMILGKALGSDEEALRLVAPAIADDWQNSAVRGAIFDDEGHFIAGDETLAQAGAAFVNTKHELAPPPGGPPFGAPGPGPGGPPSYGGPPGAPPNGPHTIAKGPYRYRPYPGGYIVFRPGFDFLVYNLGPYWLTLGAVLVIALLIAWLAGRVLARQALTPIVQVTDALDSLGRGDFSKRTSVQGEPTEIDALAAAYNSAAEKVGAAFEERRRTEEMMRQFSADAGHELRTPLTVISGYVSVLRRGAVTEPKVADEILTTIAAEGERMRLLIDKLLALARLDSMPVGEPELLDAGRAVREAAEGSRMLAAEGTLHVDVQEGLPVRAYPDELREAVRNLIENAAKHAATARIDITARRDGDQAVIEVSDDGPGMPLEEQQHAFERFYRGALRGNVAGSGLGLAIVKKAVERVGGSVELRSEQGKGTKVTMRLPLAAS
jgi:signal transduction histidine kinase